MWIALLVAPQLTAPKWVIVHVLGCGFAACLSCPLRRNNTAPFCLPLRFQDRPRLEPTPKGGPITTIAVSRYKTGLMS